MAQNNNKALSLSQIANVTNVVINAYGESLIFFEIKLDFRFCLQIGLFPATFIN